VSINLALKLFLTPSVLFLGTWVARHCGSRIAGLVGALPHTAGPISLFYFLEQGPGFARHAALGTLLGAASVCVFAVTYATACRWLSPLFTWLVAAAAFLSASYLLGSRTWNIQLALPLVAAVILISERTIKRFLPASQPAKPMPPWDLSVRICFAVAMVLALTNSAPLLGATWAGLLSTFPVFGTVMSVFQHLQAGPGSAARLLLGVVQGCAGFAAFFAVLHWQLQDLTSYLLAFAAAVAINGLLILRR
jgi:hypothetical protein